MQEISRKLYEEKCAHLKIASGAEVLCEKAKIDSTWNSLTRDHGTIKTVTNADNIITFCIILLPDTNMETNLKLRSQVRID